MRKLVAGNWKMNGLRADGLALAREVAHRTLAARRAGAVEPLPCDILICPPATLLPLMAEEIDGSGVLLGGQDCHYKASGAHTGDICASMLKDAGCSHVILGHSERRTDHKEANELIRQKTAAARETGLISVVCIGETAAERDAGQTIAVVEGQLAGSLPEGIAASELIVAYEPVWAIGTGRTPTVQEVETVHGRIRAALKERIKGGEEIRLLYGGSVKPSNARELMQAADVDGALVGGASLVASDFWEIVRACRS